MSGTRGNVKRCIHFGKHFKFPWQFPIHLSIFTVSSWNSTPGYLPKRNENIYPHKDLSRCFIHSNWKLARTKRPWTGERMDRLGYTHAMQYGIPAHQQKETNYWCTYVTKRWSILVSFETLGNLPQFSHMQTGDNSITTSSRHCSDEMI